MKLDRFAQPNRSDNVQESLTPLLCGSRDIDEEVLSPEGCSVEGSVQVDRPSPSPLAISISSTPSITKVGKHAFVITRPDRAHFERFDEAKRRAQEASQVLIEAHPNLRCLHLSARPVPEPILYRLDRRRYKHSIIKASPGRRPLEEGGTGKDIWYSIFLDGRFTRLEEELQNDYESRFAYMFNIPFVKRHVSSGKRPSTVIRMSTNTTLKRISEDLGKDIYDTYGGYEIGLITRERRRKGRTSFLDWHLQEGYGVVWNTAAIRDWTLVATLEGGRSQC